GRLATGHGMRSTTHHQASPSTAYQLFRILIGFLQARVCPVAWTEQTPKEWAIFYFTAVDALFRAFPQKNKAQGH
ncbi:MAG: hypothetical protein LIP23_04985, partial [Planctomycetes bacterium]|nr:hypothetical protein [Planctomycetota bacterium]